MATRYYLPVSGAPPISPAIDSSWQVNTASPTRVLLVTAKSGTDPFVTQGPVAEDAVAATRNVFFRQYISEPIGAQTISGTITGWIRASESNAAANANGQLVVKVVSGDGATVRGTLLAAHTQTTVTNEFTTTLSTRLFPGTGGTLTSVTAQNGDRIVIEVGVRAQNTVNTAYTYQLQFGQRSDTLDATASGGAGTTNTWLEFSADIAPATAADVPKAAPDTHTVVSSDTASRAATATASDTHALVSTDTITQLSGAGLAAETRALTHTDTATRAATGTSTDTHALGHTDTATVAAQTAHTAPDAHLLVASDTASVTTQQTLAAPDTHVVGSTDAATGTRTGTAADTHAIAASEAATGPRTGTTGDTSVVSGVDQVAITGANNAVDAATLAAAESSTFTGISTLADTHSATGDDTAATSATSDAPDAATLVGTDAVELVAGSAWFADDTHIITGTDGVSLMVYMASDDTAVVAGDDTGDLSALLLADDTHAIASVDTYSMSTELPPVIPVAGSGIVTRVPTAKLVAQRVAMSLGATRTPAPAIQVTRVQAGDILTVERTQEPARLDATRVQEQPPLAVNRTLHDAPIAVSRYQHPED